MRASGSSARISLLLLQHGMVNVKSHRFDSRLVEEKPPVTSVKLVARLNLPHLPVGPKQPVLKHRERKGVPDEVDLEIYTIC